MTKTGIEGTAQGLSVQANIGAADVKARRAGRSQKTLSKVGINELLRGI